MTQILLTRDQVLSAARDALPFEDVPVESWGGAVRVRGLNLGERFEMQARSRAAIAGQILPGQLVAETPEDLAVALVIKTVIGADGASLFTEQDASALRAGDIKGFEKVWMKARVLSGIATDAPDGAASDMEAAVKN